MSQQDTSGSAIVQRWSDLPDNESNFIVTNSGYSTGWILQTATSTSTYTDIYRRIIPRSGATGTPSNWVKLGYLDPRLKVLAIGDSICAGVRNDGKGFVGYLGLPYKNAGVSGAALSTVRSNSNVEDIPSRFIRFVDYHNPDSTTEDAAKDGWEPDIIIANGTLSVDQSWIDMIQSGLPEFVEASIYNGNTVRLKIDANAVPEPSTWALLILGAAGLLYVRKRK